MSDYAIYLTQVPSVIDVATGPAPFVAVNPPPVLLALGVSSVPLGSGAQAVPLIGTSFVATTVAAVDGVPVATVFVDSSHLTATLPAPLIATAGVKAVTAVSPGPGGGTSTSLPLSVLNPAVTLTAISPARATEGAPDTLFTLTGTGFVQGVTVVKAGATVLASTWVSATSMTATLTAAQLAAATTYGITATNPTPGGGVSASQTFTVVAQILWDTGDLSLLSAGQVNVGLLASLGLLFSRASVATLMNTGATNVLDTSVPIDIPRVENRGTGVKGLLFEESRVNGQFFSSQLGSWGTSGTTPAAVGSLVTTDAATAPDGTTSADRVAPSATGGLLFTGSGPSFTSTGATVTNSIWLKHRAGSSGSIRGVCSFNGQGVFDSDGTIKTWKRYTSTYTSSGATCNSALTIVSPNIPDVDVWGSQCEPGAYPTSYIVQANSVLATRAGERMYRLLAPLLDGGRLGLHVRFCPLGSSSEQTTNVRIFSTTGGDYAEVNKTTRVLTVFVAGVTVTLGALPTWARGGDVFDIFIACGGGVLTTTASCRLNGGATVNLSFGAAQGTLTGTYLDVICNGTTQQFSSDFARGVAYSAGVKPSWATSAGSVVTTTTSSMTVTTGQRWQNAVAATITGAGFNAQCQVCVDGVPIPAIQNLDGTTTPAYAYVNPTTMTVTLPDTAFWTTGTRAITVIDAFGAASNPQNVMVTYEAAITSHSRNDASSITTSAGVAQVLDTTGNARHLAAVTGSKQPAPIAAGLNGRTTWRCDAIDDRLKTPSFAVAQPCGFVAVRKAVTYATGRIEIDGSDAANQNVLAQQGTSPQLQAYAFAGAGYTAANGQAPVGAFRAVHVKFAASVASIQVNWGVATTGATGTGGIVGLGFGGSGTDTNFANVEGAELLSYNAATISSATLANYARELESVHGGAVAKRRNVVFVGDSITEGTAVSNPAQRYVAQVAARPEFANGSWSFTNKGVSGRTVADITAAYTTDVVPLYDPDAVNILVLLIGTNGIGSADVSAAIASYCVSPKAAGWLIVTCAIPSVIESEAVNDIYRTPCNATLAAQYATNGTAFCGFTRTGMMALSDNRDTTRFLDRKHPGPLGNTYLVNDITPILAKVGY